PVAVDRDDDVVEGQRDGRLRLVHGDVHGDDLRAGEHGVGDPLGDGLDEVHRVAAEDRVHVLRDEGVVDRLGEVVPAGCRARVEVQGDVGAEVLSRVPLALEDAVETPGGDAADVDLVERISALA